MQMYFGNEALSIGFDLPRWVKYAARVTMLLFVLLFRGDITAMLPWRWTGVLSKRAGFNHYPDKDHEYIAIFEQDRP